MNNLLKITVAGASLLLTSNAIAAKPMSQNQKLTQCKSLANAQFENVKVIKTVKIKNNRVGFNAKFKIVGENDRGIFLCTIATGEEAKITRLDKTTPKAVVKSL